MIYGIAYVVGEEGKKSWEQYWMFNNLTPLQTSKEKIDSLRTDFYDNQGGNFIDLDKYLVDGVYLEFLGEQKDMILALKGNSKESVNGLAKKLELPQDNKANLSE